jgi:predicted transcriptional regulator
MQTKLSPKEAVIEMIQRMPDDATLSDIIYALEVREEIEEGLRQLDAGEVIPHEEAMKRLSRWLK